MKGGSKMSVLDISSQVTFLYFENIEETIEFFEEILGLERVMDKGWVYVWKVAEKSFIGAVDEKQGSIPVKCRGGFMTSITVKNIEEVYEHLKKYDLEGMTELSIVEKVPLRSIFFKGPSGYEFEIQEFINPEDIDIF